jgi:NADPH:quinone reductase-like Zn-dependent oxidoreductase
MSKKMKAVLLPQYGEPDVFRLENVDRPHMAAHNEVLIEVHAAGVNPFDCKLRRGYLQQLFPFNLPHVIGNDIAGIVVDKGFDVSELEIGDRVYGLIDPMCSGGYAEYTATKSYLVRRMPKNLSFEEAASVPMAGVTAWHGLKTMANVQPGQRVLVQAGAGGVGSYGIQIAKHFGAWVATTCGTGNADYVKSLGADQVIDYTKSDFRNEVSDIDIVLDPIGREVILRSYEVIKPGGTLLVILRGDQIEMEARERLMKKHNVTTKVVAFSAQPEVLDEMRPLFESGVLKPTLTRVLPLEQAAEAHRLSETGHTRGKMVLKIK